MNGCTVVIDGAVFDFQGIIDIGFDELFHFGYQVDFANGVIEAALSDCSNNRIKVGVSSRYGVNLSVVEQGRAEIADDKSHD